MKDGQFRNVSYCGNSRKERFLPLDTDELTKYYHIFIQVGLTGIESGEESDYMSLDLVAEMASPREKMIFEILSHGAR